MKTWIYNEYLVRAKNKKIAIEKFKEKFGLILKKYEIKQGPYL